MQKQAVKHDTCQPTVAGNTFFLLSDVEYECNLDEYKAYLETTGEWLKMQIERQIET
jgi:hypothetical protein